MLLENYVGRILTFDELKKSEQTCISHDDISKAINGGTLLHPVKDYTQYLVLTSVYMAAIALVFGMFFRTQQKRSSIDNNVMEVPSIEENYVSNRNT